MAISPLYLLKESYNFSLDTIAIKCPNNAFAAVHGVYNQAWDNGRHPDTGERIPGAFDSRGEELAVKLPKPLLTGKDRKPLAKDPSWSIGDLGIAKSSQTFSDGSIVQLFRDDGSTTPLWALVKGETHYTCADRQPGAYAGLLHVERIVPQFEQEKAAEEYSPGDYVRTDQLTKEQLTEFAEAIIGKGANPSEWRNYGHSPSIFKLFGWKADGNKTFFGDNTHHFTNDITDRFTQGDSTMTSPRNPFQVGDKVVPNGFGAGADGSLLHGRNPTMARWERTKTVLTVDRTEYTKVLAGTDDTAFNYHFSELRMATQPEIDAAVPKPPPAPEITLERGMLVKTDSYVAMIARHTPDGDNEISVIRVDTGAREYLPITGARAKPFTILGRIMLDGDFRPAEAAASPASDPRTWKKGQRVRCASGAHHFVTEGNIYTLVEDASVKRNGDIHIVIYDNDGDHCTYPAKDFVAI